MTTGSKSLSLRLMLFVLASAILTASAFAQLSTATMFGTITDSTGAVIPHATITLTQIDTNFARVSTTKDDGSFHEEFLPIGPYKVTVAAAGFKTLNRTGIVLAVMQNAALNLILETGVTNESITVNADVPLVNLGDATLGRTVSNLEIDNLPLINRDAMTRLLQLVPGVQSVQTVNNLGYPELKALINGSTDGFVGQVSYYLDGGLNMTGLRNSGNVVPNPDAINQFNVQTNNYDAQIGRYSAAAVSVVTKSGTNQYHGSVFEFYRTRNFNAVTHNQQTKAPYTRNQFGATFGGPIRHDKDFFFGSFGGLRYTTSPAYTGSIPSAAQMIGNFSENMPLPGEQLDKNNKPSCAVAPTTAMNAGFRFFVCNPVTHTPYAGNILPAVDPTAANVMKYLNFTPNPSAFGDTKYTHREYAPTPEKNEEYLIKTDHQITPSHRVTLSYFLFNYSIRSVPTTLTQKWSYSDYATRQQNANVSDVWTVSPRTVNQFWVNYTRQNGGRDPIPGNSTLADFGSDFGVVGTPSRSQIAVNNGWFTLGQAIVGPKAGANLYGLRDVLTTTRGQHSLYLGGEVGLEKDFQLTSLFNYGVFSYATTTNARTNNALSDFVAGMPQNMQQDTGLYAQANYFNYALFAQDNWRILPTLTLNLGVRYDVQQAPTDPGNRQTNFSPGVQSHAFSNVSIVGKTGPQLAPIGMLFPGDPGVSKTGAGTQYNHVSPRVGFAFDPYGNGKTVFHGAAGIFFGGISGNQWEFPSNFPPYAVRNTYTKVVSMTHPYQGDPTEFPSGTNPYPALNFQPGSGNATFLPLNQVVAFDPNYKWPFTYQVNFGFQQQLTNGLALSANYVGSFNKGVPLYNDINAPIFNINPDTGQPGAACFTDPAHKNPDTSKACGYANTSSTVNNRRPLNSQYGQSAVSPLYSNVWIIRSNQGSNYNGLQVSLEQRITHRLSARGYYTWSRTLQSNQLDSTSGLNGNFVDPNFPDLEKRQRSDQDRRHMMTMSFNWKPDYFSGYNWFVRNTLNGWTVAGIWTANSGQPFTVTTGLDVNGDGQNNDRPSIVPGKTPRLISNGRSRVAMMNQWFDTSAYCTPGTAGCPGVGPGGLLGNVPPAQLDSPGFRNVDASLFRTFAIRESFRFELRSEFTNVFNLTNLGTPTATANSANFGKVTGNSGNNRIMQVGGRLLF
ncbi:MAG TPA: TonB-dependent receptor [Edaphobacter sp.]|nr:TonB-dependent receptor [Edaphobacter sp.]